MIPKFTIRQMLIGMIAFAGISIVLSLAFRGNLVAYGLSVAILGLVVPAVVYAVFYWFAKLFSGAEHDSEKYESPAFGPDELSK